MSKFFKALEQADRDRALQERTRDTAPRVVGSVPQGPGEREDDPPSFGPPSFAPRVAVSPPPIETESSGDELAAIDERLVSLLAPGSTAAEQYRALRHEVEQAHRATGLAVIAVSSPASGDGKTMTAINLAGALAQATNARVLLIDADLRRPSVSEHFGLSDDGRGLVDAIVYPGISLDHVVRRFPQFNLSILPAGAPPAVQYEILKSARLEELIAEARARFDYVVIDTPPLAPYPDCRLVGRCVDGFLVVVRAHRTPRRLLRDGLAALDGGRILGLVFNSDELASDQYHDSGSAGSPNGDGPFRMRTRPGRA